MKRRGFIAGMLALLSAPSPPRASGPVTHYLDLLPSGLYRHDDSLIHANDGDHVVYRGGPDGDKRYRIQRLPVRPGVRSMVFHPA